MTQTHVEDIVGLIMPTVYVGPLGLPLYHQDINAHLASAIMAYFSFQSGDRAQEPNEIQMALVTGWCRYFINAPCWDSEHIEDSETANKIEILRERAGKLKTADDVREWIAHCLKAGLDPF